MDEGKKFCGYCRGVDEEDCPYCHGDSLADNNSVAYWYERNRQNEETLQEYRRVFWLCAVVITGLIACLIASFF